MAAIKERLERLLKQGRRAEGVELTTNGLAVEILDELEKIIKDIK
jgi:hypothetical protein